MRKRGCSIHQDSGWCLGITSLNLVGHFFSHCFHFFFQNRAMSNAGNVKQTFWRPSLERKYYWMYVWKGWPRCSFCDLVRTVKCSPNLTALPPVHLILARHEYGQNLVKVISMLTLSVIFRKTIDGKSGGKYQSNQNFIVHTCTIIFFFWNKSETQVRRDRFER